MLFKSAQSATAVKQKVQSFGQGQQHAKNFAVNFSSQSNNPFRTLPKDGPMRSTTTTHSNRSGMGQSSNFGAGGFRGRGGGYHNRGSGINTNNNFNRGSYHGGYQGSGMSNFSQMGSMPSYGGFQGRGGMGGLRGSGMNMRGGRGGVMGMPMGMGMGGMGMGMGMAPMGGMGGMSMAGKYTISKLIVLLRPTGVRGRQGGADDALGNQGVFNPAFFNQQSGGSVYGGADNPHPTKRTRQD